MFEGVDRCGKSTQSLRLQEFLVASGLRARLMRFPGEASRKDTGGHVILPIVRVRALTRVWAHARHNGLTARNAVQTAPARSAR